jgi:3-dehydroquinate synthetase
MAELIKAAVIGSPRLFQDLRLAEPTLSRLLGQGRTAAKVTGIVTALPWSEWIVLAARVKARIVAADFEDAGPRQALNLGHTLGHALEAHSGCSHGEAVAVGMATAVRLAVKRGLCRRKEGWPVIDLLQAIGLPVTAIPPPRVVLSRLLQGDKKHTAQRAAWVLPERIGKVRLNQQVDPAEAAVACRG